MVSHGELTIFDSADGHLERHLPFSDTPRNCLARFLTKKTQRFQLSQLSQGDGGVGDRLVDASSVPKKTLGLVVDLFLLALNLWVPMGLFFSFLCQSSGYFPAIVFIRVSLTCNLQLVLFASVDGGSMKLGTVLTSWIFARSVLSLC